MNSIVGVICEDKWRRQDVVVSSGWFQALRYAESQETTSFTKTGNVSDSDFLLSILD